MSTQIIATKLYIPTPRYESVTRARLIERLNAGLNRKLMLISAPAGFGKTTLLSEWIANLDWHVAWVSLDEGDNDSTRFLTYLIAALQTVAPHIGEGITSLLLSPQPPPIESVLTTLLNEIAAVPDNILLVLDDYHLIDSKSLDDVLAFLLEHLPPQIHIVISSREDPQFPLARLRARNQMTELRAADLRFTLEEAGSFLNTVLDLSLSADDIAALETRTEGWIAGLQLAAISIQGHNDTTSFIQSFTGSHRFVLDYLVEEVLQQQPDHVQKFLLSTSILKRLCNHLCETVAGISSGSGQETLEYLERTNLFVVPLDSERRWYRYHHLFAEVLHKRLRTEYPDQLADLHRRASEWYEENEYAPEAIRHALAAEDFERAARLIERIWLHMRRTRQEATLLTWTNALPEELYRFRPALSVGYAWALLDAGELDAAESRLQDAERLLETTKDESMQSEVQGEKLLVENEDLFRSLPASIANARAFRAQTLGDISGTVKYTRQALELLPEDNFYERGAAAALLGLAYWSSGDLEAAYQSFSQGVAHLHASGSFNIVLGATVILAHICMAQGRLNEAFKICEDALHLSTMEGEPILKGTAELYLGLSELYYKRGEMDAARQYLLKGETLRDQASLPGYEYLWCTRSARIKESEGNVDAALALLDESERLYYRSPIPNVRPITALKVRTQLRAGRLEQALEWAHEQNPFAEDDLSYVSEYAHLTLARVLITQYRQDRAQSTLDATIRILERLLQAAEAGNRVGSAIEILILQALVHHALGDTPAALVLLERALAQTEPEGYASIFVDEGKPMKQLLHEAANHEIRTDFIHKLLKVFATAEQWREEQSDDPDVPSPQPLVDPLTEREQDVLRMFTTELSGPEIARELGIALSTVRTHTKNIYNKLNVGNRRAAINRARELDLI